MESSQFREKITSWLTIFKFCVRTRFLLRAIICLSHGVGGAGQSGPAGGDVAVARPWLIRDQPEAIELDAGHMEVKPDWLAGA